MTPPIKRELGIFLIVGLLTVGIDFLIYRGFIYLQPFGIDSINIANGFSFISGTIFSYFANRFWTFNQQTTGSGSVFRFVMVYILGLIANIAINYLCIEWFSSPAIAMEYTLLIAFILATGVSASLNFIGMKFFVFTHRKIDKS
ncbi:MAG: GtrA family protein [Rhodoferax sp.]|nr:GtrA family protein [Rhodoferax sp.]